MRARTGPRGSSPQGPAQKNPSCVPLVAGKGPESANGGNLPKRPAARHNLALVKDSQIAVWRDGAVHIISESYFYKTEPYYAILRHELEGTPVRPASQSILDAYVVPVCLERASLAGIPVLEWEISQGYTPLPSILYGLNYFATTSEYFIVRNNERAKEATKHITNKGKYPFCYQKLPDHAEIRHVIAIFGKTTSLTAEIDTIASKVYGAFAIPLVTMVLVNDANGYRLSSLSPTKYSQMTAGERSLISAYITGQEFL